MILHFKQQSSDGFASKTVILKYSHNQQTNHLNVSTVIRKMRLPPNHILVNAILVIALAATDRASRNV